jgi:hypothetical protein
MTLRAQLHDLASSFADAIVDVIRFSSLDELSAQTGIDARLGRGPLPSSRAERRTNPGAARESRRLPRRSLEAIGKQLADVVALVRESKEGLRAEQIRERLGVQAKELPRVLQEGLSTQVLTCKGNKRATTYFVT